MHVALSDDLAQAANKKRGVCAVAGLPGGRLLDAVILAGFQSAKYVEVEADEVLWSRYSELCVGMLEAETPICIVVEGKVNVSSPNMPEGGKVFKGGVVNAADSDVLGIIATESCAVLYADIGKVEQDMLAARLARLQVEGELRRGRPPSTWPEDLITQLVMSVCYLPFFEDLDHKQLRYLVRSLRFRRVRQGDSLGENLPRPDAAEGNLVSFWSGKYRRVVSDNTAMIRVQLEIIAIAEDGDLPELDDELHHQEEDNGRRYLKRYGDLRIGAVLGQRGVVDPGGPDTAEPIVRCEGPCEVLSLSRNDYLHCLKEQQVERMRIIHALRNIEPSRPGEPHHRSEEQLSLLAKLVKNTPELKTFERPALMQVLGAATYINAAPGHVLCHQGEFGDRFFAIIDGMVSIHVKPKIELESTLAAAAERKGGGNTFVKTMLGALLAHKKMAEAEAREAPQAKEAKDAADEDEDDVPGQKEHGARATSKTTSRATSKTSSRHEQEAPPVAEPEQIPSVKTPRMAETPASPSASEGASLAPSPSASATPGRRRKAVHVSFFGEEVSEQAQMAASRLGNWSKVTSSMQSESSKEENSKEESSKEEEVLEVDVLEDQDPTDESQGRRLGLRERLDQKGGLFWTGVRRRLHVAQEHSSAAKQLGKMVNRMGPGAAFGAKTLLKREARTASVQTVEHTKLLVVTREDFVALVDNMEEARAREAAEFLCRHVLKVEIRSGSGRALDNLHPALRQRMVRTSKAMTIRTLDRGAVLLTHGAENSGVVHILRKGALAYCFPPERKEEPANRWHRCAVASMNPSQVVTTLGELVGAYHALLGEKEPATVRVESASCEVYRIPWVELKRVLTKRVLTELREKLLRCHDLRSGIAATHTPRDLLKVTASSSVKGAMPTREQQAVKDALSEAFDAVCAYAEGCGEGLSAATEKVKHKQSSSLLSATSTASPEERRKAFEQSVAKAVASLEEATKNAGLWESLSTGEAPHDAEPRSQPPPVTSTAHVRAQFLQVLKEDGGIGMAKFVTEAVLDPVKGNLNAWIQKYMDSERLRKHSDLQTLQLILRRQQKSGTKANDKAGSRLEKSAGADQRPGKRRSQAS
ncbi:unnamed protein product [Effrenium voratum]|nr:unnamed protein product [Effrenium voratum]